MACGEGYGSDVLAARGAAERRRRRRQPGGPRARPAALRAAQPALRARPGRELRRSPATPSSSCRRSSTSRTRARSSSTSSRCWPRGPRLRLDPEPADPGARGCREVRQPLARQGVPGGGVPRLCEDHFPRVEMLGLFHARKLRAHEIAIGLGWDSRPQAARADQALLRPLHPGDRRLRLRPAQRRPREGPRLRRRLPCLRRGLVGSARGERGRPGDRPPLAHALRRGLRDLSVRRGVALRRGDPLLPAGARRGAGRDADGDPGARRPARGRRASASACADFLVEWRIGAAEADAPEVPPECRPACEAELRALPPRARAARRGRRRSAAAFPGGRERGAGRARGVLRDPRRAAAARDPRRACACRSTPASARTAGASAGRAASGCPSAPTRRASSGRSPSTACDWFCVDQSAHAPPLEALTPVRDGGRAGGAADRLGGGQLALVARRLPLRPRPCPVRRQIAARDPDLEGRRRRLRPGGGRRGGAPPGRGVPRRGRRAPARLRGRARAARPARLRDRHRAARPLVVGGGGLARGGARRGRGRGGPAAHARRRRSPSTGPGTAPLRRSTWGEDKDLRTWDSPGRRRHRLGLAAARAAPAAGARRRACRAAAAARAARELLAVQASDWAFLDGRGEAGDYAFQRATGARRSCPRGHRIPGRHATRACARSPRT